ncbi:MAG: insulinase family protein [Cyanothece sp. SIO1E1]|nr:insulinase family protein [Cyanothece sp. SIO1E1]
MQWFEFLPRASSSRKRRLLLMTLAAAIVLLISGLRSPAVANTAKYYTELEFPPLAELQVPEYERFQLENGMVVYLVEDHELPLVNGNALFRTGDRLEPSEQVGLAGLVGTVMRTGGTMSHPAAELNQILEERAAAVETGMAASLGSANFSALSEDLDEVFSLFAEVIREPAFEPDQVNLAQSQTRGAIARRNDNPNKIATREFRKLIYGYEHPYARTVEYETLDNITRDDLIQFYQASVQPEKTILGVVGDFEPTAMKALIEERFGDWQANAGLKANDELPAVEQVNQGGLFFANQPQLNQSYVQIGHLGGMLDNPDYPALSVVNSILNGFGGRLVQEVRARQGLAYTVFGFWSPQFDHPGLFISGGQTSSETTVPFIQSVFKEIDKIRTIPVTAAELAYAKESVLNSFVFRFQSPTQILARLMRYEYYGYPEDFIFRYQRDVEAVTVEDILRVAQTYLKPDDLVTMVVGNQDAIQPTLSTLKPDVKVTQVDVTIPEPKT